MSTNKQAVTLGRGRNPGKHRVMGISVRTAAFLLLLAIGFFTAGCARIHTEKGLDPNWYGMDADTFRVGVSNQADVLDTLGPPSQIITGSDGDIFYYLYEEALGTGMIFILYNQVQLTTRYDRAIFFFDAAGVLQDYAVSEPPQPAK